MDRLEILLERAAENIPPEPQPIPRQRVPRFIRKGLQVLIYPFMILDLYAQKIAKKIIKPPYILTGECKKRGSCCHYILMQKPKGIFGRLYYFWNTEINGFYLREKKDTLLVMGCRHLKKDGSCGHYRYRPLVCRQWPMVEHFGTPRILKGCGFKVEKR